MKKWLLAILAILPICVHAQTNRFPPINLYGGDPTGIACPTPNTLVQSTTTGGIYSCVGGVWTTAAGFPTTIPCTIVNGCTGATTASGADANLGVKGQIPYPSLTNFPLTGWTAEKTVGDSRMCGGNDPTTSRRWVNQLATETGAALSNLCVSGSLVPDATNVAFNNASPSSSTNTLFAIASGANDIGRNVGTTALGNNPAMNQSWIANAVWFSLANGNGSFIDPSTCTQTGTWTTDTTYSGVTGLQSNVNGSTLTCTFTTTSQLQYVLPLMGLINGDAGNALVSDSDSGSVGPTIWNTSPHPNLFLLASGPLSNANGLATVGAFFVNDQGRVPNTYTEQIEVTSATGAGTVHFYGLALSPATPNGQPLLALDVYRNRNDLNSDGTTAVNANIDTDCALMNTLNFPVWCVGMQNVVHGYTALPSTANPEFYGTGSLPANCSTATGAWIHGCGAVDDEIFQAIKNNPSFSQGENPSLTFAGPTPLSSYGFPLSYPLYVGPTNSANSGQNYIGNGIYIGYSKWTGSAPITCYQGLFASPNAGSGTIGGAIYDTNTCGDTFGWVFNYLAAGTEFDLAGLALTGNQGDGLLLQHSIGSAVVDDLVVFDSAGNTIDSGTPRSAKITGTQLANPTMTLDSSAYLDNGGTSSNTVVVGTVTASAGDGMVCEFNFQNATFVSLTDNVNNTEYQQAALTTNGGWVNGIYYLPNLAAGATTVTLTVSAAQTSLSMACQAWKNSSTTGTFTLDPRFVQGLNGTGDAPTTGTAVTPASDNEIVIGSADSQDGTTFTPGAGYTLIQYGSFAAMEYWIQTTATSTNAPFTLPSTPNHTWADAQAAFYFLNQALPNGTQATTQSVGDNTNKVATDAFVLANGPSGSFTALTGDATSTSTGGATTVIGLDGVPFCTGYTPTNGQAVTLTTASSPNPCYTAVSGGGSMVYPGAGIGVSTGSAWTTSLTAPSGAIVGTTDTQTLTNKTLDGVTPTTMGYVDPTSSIQTQLNGKQAALSLVAGTYTNGDICTYASSGTLLNCNTAPVASPSETTVSYSATPTFSATATLNTITLTGNVTSSTLAAGTAGFTTVLNICQDGSGSHTFVFPSNVRGYLTIGSTASKCSVQSFTYSSVESAWMADSAGVINE